MKGLVVAANRLPIEISADGQLNPSPGGLASALSSVTAAGTQWVGWAGPDAVRPKPFDHGDLRLHPVTLSVDDVDRYYRGFSNAILWPLFHGRLRRVELNRAWWNAYRVVNRRFANAIAQIAPLGGTVWVHDYHLLLVPAMIREKRPDLRIGLFLHIPFPNAQLFAMLPWREEVIAGMLGADVVGFQIPEDVANFMAAAKRLIDPRILVERSIRGRVRSMSTRSRSPSTSPLGIRSESKRQPRRSKNRQDLGVESVLLGIDRLDYTKGISQRLRAFGELLDSGQSVSEKCTFVQVAVPSRSEVAAYEDERDEVEQLIERINAKHRRPNGSTPVHYIDYSLDEVAMACVVPCRRCSGGHLPRRRDEPRCQGVRRRACGPERHDDPQRVCRCCARSRWRHHRQSVRHRRHQERIDDCDRDAARRATPRSAFDACCSALQRRASLGANVPQPATFEFGDPRRGFRAAASAR